MTTKGGTSSSNSKYLRTDQWNDVIASLHQMQRLLEATPNDSEWKWIALACHSALQGICVCHLTQTDGTGALDKNATKDVRGFFEMEEQKRLTLQSGGKWILPEPEYPLSPRIASLPDLLKKIGGEKFQKISGREPPDRKHRTEWELWHLHDIRNQLVHFTPMSLSIEKDFLNNITITALTHALQIHQIGYKRVEQYAEDPAVLIDSLLGSLKALSGTQRGGKPRTADSTV